MAGGGAAFAPARREAVPEIDISAMTIVRPRRWGRIAAVAIMDDDLGLRVDRDQLSCVRVASRKGLSS